MSVANLSRNMLKRVGESRHPCRTSLSVSEVPKEGKPGHTKHRKEAELGLRLPTPAHTTAGVNAGVIREIVREKHSLQD